MTEHENIVADDLLRGDRIEDASSTGLVVKSVRHGATNISITDIHGWDHFYAREATICVRLPRQSALELLP